MKLHLIIWESQQQMSKEGVWISIGGFLAESGGQGAGSREQGAKSSLLPALCPLLCAFIRTYDPGWPAVPAS